MDNKTVTKAIIADAGFGSRFLPISKALPKAMMPLLEKPIMEWAILECLEAGISELYIITNSFNKEIYEKYFFEDPLYIKNLLTKQNKLERYESVEKLLKYSNITILTQEESLPYGSASPVLVAKEYVKDSNAFLMFQSDDVVIGGDAKTLVDAFNKEEDKPSGIIMGQITPENELINFGVIKLKEKSNDLDYIVERPALGTAPSNLVSYGRYLLTPEIYKYLDPNSYQGKEFLLVDAITEMAKEHNVKVVTTKGKWVTTGDPLNHLKAQIEFALSNPEIASELKSFLKSLPLE